MNKIFARHFHSETRGVTLVEYGILVGLLSAVSIGAVFLVGTGTVESVSTANASLASANRSAAESLAGDDEVEVETGPTLVDFEEVDSFETYPATAGFTTPEGWSLDRDVPSGGIYSYRATTGASDVSWGDHRSDGSTAYRIFSDVGNGCAFGCPPPGDFPHRTSISKEFDLTFADTATVDLPGGKCPCHGEFTIQMFVDGQPVSAEIDPNATPGSLEGDVSEITGFGSVEIRIRQSDATESVMAIVLDRFVLSGQYEVN